MEHVEFISHPKSIAEYPPPAKIEARRSNTMKVVIPL
jgi:hypothetical protein